ncbi:MAG: tRNA (adenosine(37)-N6)-threonylcarbamoyltransferase complex ATPase subunit type 1 TsaE [Firmicutes bacterium]|nr:tRNA (adenosine(37)-N6)-threonylcarbamoyltransferase complex ATPase subunit type 1 TsaE [Bacillota bacterium]
MKEKACIFQTRDPEETKKLAQKLARCLHPGDVITLEGDLGAGKTTFAQGLAAGLGIEEPVDSPTFTLIKEYPQGALPLYHMDAYRLDFPAEELGWDEYFYGEGITLVEWPSRIQPMLPKDRIQIEIQLETDSRRRIEIQPPEGETDRICGGVKDRETADD